LRGEKHYVEKDKGKMAKVRGGKNTAAKAIKQQADVVNKKDFRPDSKDINLGEQKERCEEKRKGGGKKKKKRCDLVLGRYT